MGDRIERALLEAVSLCINSDVCDRCLLSNEAAIRQDACSAVLQVVRHAMSCPTTSSTQRLVDVLFSFLLRSLPTTVFRRRHCGVYYSLLADIMQLSRAHHPSLLSNGPLQQGLTAEGLADLLCSLLLLCPAYECRAGIDSAAHVEDELLQGVAVTLTALVSGKSADLCERVGCDNAVICFLLSVCLDTVSLPSPAEHVLDRMTASEGTVQSALWRRCVAAIGRCLQADPDDVVKVSLSQQTAAMPKARREPTRRACVLLLRALCAGKDWASVPLIQRNNHACCLLTGSQRCAEVAAECAAAARSLKCFQEHAGCAPSADVLDACSLRIRGMSTDATGICNPASVCYVTSISQLLYSIPEFRAVVLSMDMSSVALSSVSVESKSIVVELQLLFARLLYSHCHTVSVEALVAVMMDETGVPFTVFEQRDAVRVMTKILTAVEQVGSCVYASQLPNPKVGRVHFLKHIIGGLFAHEFSAAGALSLVCEDHVKFSRMESFFMLGARVSSDVDSLCATLEATCSAADKIPGFDWTEHLRPHLTTAVNTNLKFDTEKRTLISLLPRNLLVHIQRYDFDFDHCVQVKLNHRLEFPDSLQLPSNCLESTCRSRTYSLSGILLHSGEALSGHYKSFVKSGESTKFLQSVLSDDAPDDLGALRSAVVEVGSVMSLHDAPPSVPVPTATLKSLTSLLTARADGRMDPQTHAALPPDPPSEAEVGLGLALDKLIQLVDRGGNLCTENNLYWMECNDERISIVATTAIVDAAFGWKQDDTCSTEIKKKKKRKVKPNTATAVGEASIEQRSSAMLLVYKSAETDTDVFCPFINVDNILNLFISVRNENIGYWEQQRGNDWSSYSFMLWLAHCSPFGSASVVQSCLQQVYLLDLLMETNPITLDEQSAQMLPGTIHWLLKTATLDCSESERRVPKLFQCRLSTCLSSALVSAVKTSLSIHPFATAIAPPIGDQSYVITRMISMNEVMDEGDTLNVFVEPYGFAKALIRCCIHLSPLLPYQWTTITDVLEVYVNCSDYTRHWLISNGVVAALLLAFDNTDTVAQLSCRSCAPEERRLLGLLSALCAESNVCSSAYSQAQVECFSGFGLSIFTVVCVGCMVR